jgi:hypothetical protein
MRARSSSVVAGIALAIAALFGSLAIASADPTPAFNTYDNGAPTFNYENDIALFTSQVNTSLPPTAMTNTWSLQLQPAVQQIVFGNTMTCTSTVLELPNYSDFHPNIPANYLLHSTIPNLRQNTLYRFRSTCTFQVLTDTGLVPGMTQTAVDFRIKR